MKRFVPPFSLILVFLVSFPIAIAGQEKSTGCQFDIKGTWQSSTHDQINPMRARFGSSGVMTELSRNSSDRGSAWRATGKSSYKLDDAKAPKTLFVSPIAKNAPATTLQIKTFDNGLFVTVPTGAQGAPSFVGEHSDDSPVSN